MKNDREQMEKMGAVCTLDSFSSSDAFAAVGDAPIAELSSQGGCCAGRVSGDCES